MQDIDVFISYSQKDRSFVDFVSEQLTNAGLSVWYDAHLDAGESFVDSINSALNHAKTVLSVWSSNSTQSRWVIAESLEAFHKNKYVAIRTDDAIVPVPFNSANYLQIDPNKDLAIQVNWKKILSQLGKLTENIGATLVAEITDTAKKSRTPSTHSPVRTPKRNNPTSKIYSLLGGGGTGRSNFSITFVSPLQKWVAPY